MNTPAQLKRYPYPRFVESSVELLGVQAPISRLKREHVREKRRLLLATAHVADHLALSRLFDHRYELSSDMPPGATKAGRRSSGEGHACPLPSYVRQRTGSKRWVKLH